MKKLICLLALLIFCSITNAALTPNPESFEDDTVFPAEWEAWGSGSGTTTYTTDIYIGDGTDGNHCLEISVIDDLCWGYAAAWTNDMPVIAGDRYTFSADYKMVTSNTNGGFRIEWYADLDRTNPVHTDYWDPVAPSLGVWAHFSEDVVAPAGAQYATVVLVAHGWCQQPEITRFDMISLLPTPCPYEIAGDLDNNCRVNLADVALLAANWLVDCIDDPTDPACITP
ncbi:MAG: hypothetical protein H8E62_10140 [Planctomycetes bacterium]|nr:hypothetical protein [Planctomycetota bacterium]